MAVRTLRAALAALLLLVAAPMAGAQSEPPATSWFDFSAWDKVAVKAETALEQQTATDAELEQMRREVTDWRSELQAAQSVNATRVATLREQIATLGPAPAAGATEAEDIAARRKQLNADLATAQAPGLRAVEATGRADGIVTQIDRALRQRQTNTLRQLSPSPLLPSSWDAAADEALRGWHGLTAEVTAAHGQGVVWTRIAQALLLLGAAGLILTRGRDWVDHLPARLGGRTAESSRAALAFLASLGQIALPLAGIWLVVAAARISGLMGPWMTPLVAALPGAGLALFSGRWLARQMFPADPLRRAPLKLPQPMRDRARRQAGWLAVLVALHQILAAIGLPMSGLRTSSVAADPSVLPIELSEAAAGVWHLPLLLVGGMVLFRLACVLRKVPRFTAPDPAPTRAKLTGWLGEIARLIAIAAPLAAAAGLVAGANGVFWPLCMTLALVGAVLLLQEFAVDLWTLIARGKATGQDALTPVLVGFGLALASLPVLALIWGMRPSELSEVWVRLGQGLKIGGVRLSPGALVTFAVVFTIGYLLTRAVQGTLRTSVLPKTRMEAGTQSALVSGIGYIGIFLAALVAIGAGGIDLSNLAIVAGALSVGIGFGLQNIVSNFISGIILLVERPIAVGDWIGVGQAQGIVQRISVRSTAIQTFDRTTVIVPNSDLITKEVTNWTRGNQQGRVIVPVGVAYGSDTRKVEAVLREIAEAQPTVLIDPPPAILFVGFGKDSLDFEMRMVISDITGGVGVASEIRHQINARFEDEGIEVPFSQLDVSLKKVAAESARKPLARTRPAAKAPEGAEGALPLASGMEDSGER